MLEFVVNVAVGIGMVSFHNAPSLPFPLKPSLLLKPKKVLERACSLYKMDCLIQLFDLITCVLGR